MISREKQQALEFFAQGRKAYKLMDFAGAKDFFIKALEVNPQDMPSKVYVERCSYYLDNPPPEDWDGVFIMQTK